MNKIYALFTTAIGALIYRIRGGLEPMIPRPAPQLLFALPYAVIAYKATGKKWIFFLMLAVTAAMVATGHGSYMDLGRVTREVEPETLDFIVAWFFGADTFNNAWRDAFGLAVTGLTVTLPCALVLAWKRLYVLAIVLFLSGATKAIAYFIGWELFDNTEAGEYITGAFAWGIATFIYMRLK